MSLDKRIGDVNAALGSPSASNEDKNQALALLNEVLFRSTLSCRAVFAVQLEGSLLEGAVVLALFAPPAVVDNPASIGTGKTGDLFGYLCATKGPSFMVCKDRTGNVSNDLRRWTVFSAYEAAWHVRFTTLL